MAGWAERLAPLEAEPLERGRLALHHARGFGEKGRGLARLDALPPEVGLQLHACSAVHTLGMRFALDLLWLDRDGRVVRIDREVQPRRQRMCRGARSVVEVAAGGADRWAAAWRWTRASGPDPAAVRTAGAPGAWLARAGLARLPGVDTTPR